MWVFTPFGFLSIVAKHGDDAVLVVRGRAREDVEAFEKRARAHRDTLASARPRRFPVVETPEADYRFRVELPRGIVSQTIASFVDDELTYGNFKGEVARTQGHERERVYHDVWSVLFHFFRHPTPTREPVSPTDAGDAGGFLPRDRGFTTARRRGSLF